MNFIKSFALLLSAHGLPHRHKWTEVIWDLREDNGPGTRYWREINWQCAHCRKWSLPTGIPPEGHLDLLSI